MGIAPVVVWPAYGRHHCFADAEMHQAGLPGDVTAAGGDLAGLGAGVGLHFDHGADAIHVAAELVGLSLEVAGTGRHVSPDLRAT